MWLAVCRSAAVQTWARVRCSGHVAPARAVYQLCKRHIVNALQVEDLKKQNVELQETLSKATERLQSGKQGDDLLKLSDSMMVRCWRVYGCTGVCTAALRGTRLVTNSAGGLLRLRHCRTPCNLGFVFSA